MTYSKRDLVALAACAFLGVLIMHSLSRILTDPPFHDTLLDVFCPDRWTFYTPKRTMTHCRWLAPVLVWAEGAALGSAVFLIISKLRTLRRPS